MPVSFVELRDDRLAPRHRHAADDVDLPLRVTRRRRRRGRRRARRAARNGAEHDGFLPGASRQRTRGGTAQAKGIESGPLARRRANDRRIISGFTPRGSPCKPTAPRQGQGRLPQLRQPGRDTVREFYRLNHRTRRYDFVAAKRAEFLRFDRRDDDALGGARLPQHAGRRLRPRHRAAADRAPAADGRGDPRRRPPRLVRADRLDPRPRQGAVPVRRAAVGGRRRHVPGRLSVLARRSSTASSSPTTRTRSGPSSRPARGIYAPAAASTTCTCPGATTSTCTTCVKDHLPAARAVHDPLPLVLRLAPRGRVRLPDERRTTARCCRGCRSSTPTTSTPRARSGRGSADLKPYYEDLLAKYLPATLRF